MKLQTKESLTRDFIQSKEFIHWKTDAFPDFINQLSENDKLFEFGASDYSGFFPEYVILNELLKLLKGYKDGKDYFYITLQHNGQLLFIKENILNKILETKITDAGELILLTHDFFNEKIKAKENAAKRKAYKIFLAEAGLTNKQIPFKKFCNKSQVKNNGFVDYRFTEIRELQSERDRIKDVIEYTLQQFTGTENYYKYLAGCVITDGIKYLADATGSYWFLDIISSYQSKLQNEHFQVWKLTVKKNKGRVICENGNGKQLIIQNIEFTDFLLPKITVWKVDNVILLPNEY